jgi:hypothetical protein
MPLMVADNYGSELRRLNDRFCAATGIRRSDCVLDIGCGAGQTSREAVRAAVAVRCLGRLSPNSCSSGRMGLPTVPFASSTSLNHSGPQRRSATSPATRS